MKWVRLVPKGMVADGPEGFQKTDVHEDIKPVYWTIGPEPQHF
jgi:hypothetical protein